MKPFIEESLFRHYENLDQEVLPAVLGETIDPLDYEHFNDVVETKTPAQVLVDEEIIRSNTIDYDAATSKDGRITIFKLSARSYLARDEIPFDARGVKATDESIVGFSVGTRKSPFIDEGESLLGIAKIGYHGITPETRMIFYDTTLTSSLGTTLNYDSFDPNGVYGSFGRDLYSAIFETDSVTYAGMLR
jgi:hypothetical protein